MIPLPMIQALLNSGQRLAEALREENEALARLDLSRAAILAAAKLQASDAFAAAYGAATRPAGSARPELQGELRTATEHLATRLHDLGEENRRLLERAIVLQSKVIETIAGAAIPASRPATYGAIGQRAVPRQAPSLALASRA